MPAKRQPSNGRPGKFNTRSAQAVANYLEPKLSRLEQALEAERVRIQATASGIEPEMALVIELATDPGNFARAATKIGLEWLAEDEIDLAPTDQIHPVDKHGQRRDKAFTGRLFLTMTDRRALDELLSRWRKWREDPQAGWPRGETAWRDIFPLILDIRPWGTEDRLRETGVLEDLAERLDVGASRIPFEAELWFRQTAERRALAESEVARLIGGLGGAVRLRYQLPEIRYHALLGELPADAAADLLDQPRREHIALLRCNDVWLLRPVGQCAAPLARAPEESEPAATVAELPDPDLPPIVALLDGVPLAGHSLLKDRLLIDDPDDFESAAPAQQRRHGTAMASLIVHGEIDAGEPPLRRRLYCRPIMIPDPGALRDREHIPEDTLPVDLVHRAVRRLFRGEGTAAAQAPEVCLINLSLGDHARPFLHTLSPWARLLDWLADQYGVLFIVSAGNHADSLELDVQWNDWAGTDAEAREAAVLRAINRDARHRRFDAVLLKAMLVHGARWAEAGARLLGLFKPAIGGNKIKEHIARSLGYGTVEAERVLWCTDQRATLLGVGQLADGEAHAYELPLPRDLSGTAGLRRLTATLAWLSPVAPNQQRYRKAQLWFSTDGEDKLGVGRMTDGYDHTMVRRGTVQHEIFEGTGARGFADGDALRIQVNCREDAPGLDDPVSYGLVVSLEVAEGVPVGVYQQVRQALREVVGIRQ